MSKKKSNKRTLETNMNECLTSYEISNLINWWNKDKKSQKLFFEYNEKLALASNTKLARHILYG